MKRLLAISLFLIVPLIALSACTGTRAVRLYDPSKTGPEEIAHLTVPIDVEVVSVDNRKIRGFSNFLVSYENEIHLAPGEHEIIVRYSDFWEYDEDNFEKFRSRRILLSFTADPGRYYRLTHPKLAGIRDAEKFNENPDFWIEEKDKGRKVSTAMVDESYETVPLKEPSPEKDTDEVSQSEDERLKDDWEDLSEEEKKKFREWMDKRDGK